MTAALPAPAEWERLARELQDAATPHARRAAIGDRLDLIGDPRPGLGIGADDTPEIAWCEVPGGAVSLAANANPVEVAPFWMAKYVVTFAQYKAFIEATDGYHQDTHWTGLERTPEPGSQFQRFDNHPADCVSWYDATAFSRWLTRRLGFEVRLPYEAEWQQAAAGGLADHAYPWGPTWEQGRANTFESRLGRTVAVGMYPLGASPQGIYDLAGNVWEWCQDPFEESGDPEPSGPVRRILRGGSWFNLLVHAGAMARDPFTPGYRADFFGFRIVCTARPPAAVEP